MNPACRKTSKSTKKAQNVMFEPFLPKNGHFVAAGLKRFAEQ
jgi:hypothetical protein